MDPLLRPSLGPTTSSATSLSLASTLEPSSLPHFTLSVALRHKQQTYRVTALIDSGASSNFVSQSFVQRHNIPTREKLTPTPLSSLNGEPFTSEGVTHYSTDFTMNLDGHEEKLNFNIVPIQLYQIVLGIPWLIKHDPNILWSQNKLSFPFCRQSCYPRQMADWPTIHVASPAEITQLLEGEGNIFGILAATSPAVTSSNQHPEIPHHYSEFQDLFEKEAADKLPAHQPWDHTIPLQPGTTPPFGPIYSLSKVELDALRSYLDENLARGFIRPSASPAGSPILFVKKKNGELRLCVDFRGLNLITIKNRYALPLISELLDRLQGAKYFTKLDLRGAYNLLRIAAGEEWKTAFRTRYGHFEYLVMPFGLTNAPASFQDLVNHTLKQYLDFSVIAYMDDILIYSQTEEEHIQHVKQVLAKLKEASLYVKGEKCTFHSKEVEFLGYIINTEGISMDPKKIKSIASWPTPNTLQELQSFLGFTNFYRRFIPNYSKKCLAMTALVKKDQAFLWNPEAEQAFQDLKTTFTSQQGGILVYYDPLLPCTVETDASDFAIGACLSQPDPNTAQLRPVAFFSRKLIAAERNYEIYDKEMLAIVEALKEWRVYLEGSIHQIRIITDHKNLEYFTTSKVLKRRQARWSELLGGYDFKITYRPGVNNTKADILSRRTDYLPQGITTDQAKTTAPLIRPDQLVLAAVDGAPNSPIQLEFSLKSIKKAYADDPRASKLLSLSSGPHPPEKYTLTNEGVLLYEGRTFIPNVTSLKLGLLCQHHDSPAAGHFGITKTLELLSRSYYFPKMAQFVEEYVNSCPVCQRNKGTLHKPFGLLHPLPVPKRPWSSISMDFIVKLPASQNTSLSPSPNFDSILVVVDRFTKMAHFIPCQESMNAETLAKLFLHHVFPHHGLPDDIISDRGSLFTSHFTTSLCKLVSIKQKISTSFHPQTDGQTERTNQTLEQYLRMFCNYEQTNWADLLPMAAFAYNNAQQESTKVSPFYAALGYHPNFHTIVKETTSPAAEEHISYLHQLHQSLKDDLQFAQVFQKAYADQNRVDSPELHVGDYVWLSRKHIKTTRPSNKLDYKKLGPFKILRLIQKSAVELKLPGNMRIHPVFHVSLIEPVKQNSLRPSVPQPAPVDIDSNGEELYEVDKILNVRFMKPKGRNKKKSRHFLVSWKGYTTSDDSWEPESNLLHCDALEEYKREHPAWATA